MRFIKQTINDQLLELCEYWNATPKAIKALLNAGAEVDARGKDGQTPLMFAAGTNRNPEVIESLLKAGADIEARDKNGWTPLMQAAGVKWNAPAVIKVLLKAGADIGGRCKKGRTALMIAVKYNETLYIIDALLKAGADTRAEDNKGKTAADHAKGNKNIYKTKVYWKLNEAQYE